MSRIEWNVEGRQGVSPAGDRAAQAVGLVFASVLSSQVLGDHFIRTLPGCIKCVLKYTHAYAICQEFL